MSKSRPFRILALPLVRIPHGPLRVSSVKAALDANANAKAASASGASSAPAAVTTSTTTSPPSTKTTATSTSTSTSTPASTTASNTPSETAKAIQGHGVAPESTEAPLMLYHIQQPDIPESAGPQPIYMRALDKAADEWTKLSTKKPDSWMYWFWQKGESMMDKIEYEEWALKSVHEGRGVKIAKGDEKQEKIEIPLLRPSNSSLGVPPLLPKLHRSLLHRVPYHKKMMYRFLILSPLTWPFAIIPIIPNFPLFYVLWRAWSHYKAWRGANYLESLLKLGMIVEKPSKALDDIYAHKAVTVGEPGAENVAPDATRAPKDNDKIVQQGGAAGPAGVKASEASTLPSQAKGEVAGSADGTATSKSQVFQPDSAETKGGKGTGEKPAHRYPGMMLVKGQIPALMQEFDLRPAENIDIGRAIEQADQRAQSAEKTLTLQAEGAAEKK